MIHTKNLGPLLSFPVILSSFFSGAQIQTPPDTNAVTLHTTLFAFATVSSSFHFPSFFSLQPFPTSPLPKTSPDRDMEVLTNLRDDVLKRTIDGLSDLISAVETIKQEESNFQRFLKLLIPVRELLVERQSHEETEEQKEFVRRYGRVLTKLVSEADIAIKTIEGFRSKRRWLLPFYPSVLYSLDRSFKAIDRLIQLLPLANINHALSINRKTENIINGMGSLTRTYESNTYAIFRKIDEFMMHQYPVRALSSSNSSTVYPIGIEEEEFESESDFSTNSENSSVTQFHMSNIEDVSSFFLCPLTGELLQDPVSVICDHSFERAAIEGYFRNGHNSCPICNKELSMNGKLELISNSALLGTILEWKQRNEQISADRKAKMELIDAAGKISVDDLEITNEAFDLIHDLMKERPCCISEATWSSCNLVRKIADHLRTPSVKTPAVFNCLLLIAGFSDENKEIIGKRGVIKCLLKESMREKDAVAVLLELSKSMVVAQKIGGITSAIPILISLLDNPSCSVQEMAREILENLSSFDEESIVRMAKLGYFTLFLERFNSEEISEETRTSLAKELSLMPLMDADAKIFENDRFASLLTDMLSFDSPSSKISSLNCIQQLIAIDGPRSYFLRNESFIPALFSLITTKSAAQSWSQEALGIVITLIELTTPLEYETNPGFQKLFSGNCVHNILEKIRSSAIDDQLALLYLLLVMAQKSDSALRWIVSDHNSFSCLFSAINLDKTGRVKLSALKLIHCVAAVDPIGASLPPAFVRYIVTILNQISSDEELSVAAGIISYIPPGNESINGILQSAAVLKSIHSLITRVNKSHGLLESALGALLRALNQSSSQFQKQVAKQSQADLVQILSAGTPLAKQRAATILTHLSSSTLDPSLGSSSSSRARLYMKWKDWETCSVHGSICSGRRAICLVRDGAVKPLVEMVRMTECGAAEAAFTAIDTLFDNDCDHDAAAGAIVESRGAGLVLDAMERGAAPVKERALELFSKIRENSGVTERELERFKGLLFNIVRKEEGGMKRKAGKLLKYLA